MKWLRHKILIFAFVLIAIAQGVKCAYRLIKYYISTGCCYQNGIAKQTKEEKIIVATPSGTNITIYITSS